MSVWEDLKEEHLVEKAMSSEACVETADMYGHLMHAIRTRPDEKRRIWLLERRLTALWDGLSVDQQTCVVGILVHRGAIPRMVVRVCEIFGGKVVSLI